MARRVEVSAVVSAPHDALMAALQTQHPGGSFEGESYVWTEVDSDTESPVRIAARTEVGSLTVLAEYEVDVPYFAWAFAGPMRATMRSRLMRVARQIDAAALGRPFDEEEPKQPWWAPPAAMNRDQIRVIATISFILTLVEYGNSLLTQTVDYVATTYGATDAQLGVVTALTRIGNVIVLAGGFFTDRLGRRRLLLAAVGIVLGSSFLTSLAPNLPTYATFQILVNGATNLAFMVAFIVATEEAPEGSRTYAIALAGIASGLGFAAGAILLPLADLHPSAWRGMYALSALGFVALPGISKRLTETRRFEALLQRDARTGQVSEVVDKRYGSRFFLLCLTGFLLNVFYAPTSQLTNRYLGDERGFSGLGILGLRALTQTVPALGGAYIGGKLAETKGRRPTASTGLLVGAVMTAAFFTIGGPVLWLTLAVATMGTSFAGPSLGAFSTELFPTEVRGTAGAGLTLTSVVGSATGLLLAGYLSEPLGSIGNSIAVTCIAPLLVGLFLIRLLPEARGRLLDDVSPSEV